MPVLSTTAQFDNLREDATRPITLIRWEHSGGLECISLSGDCEFDGEIYTSGHIDGDSLQIRNNDSATFTLPVTDDRLSECLNGTWRNGKICQIYEIPATIEDEDFVYVAADGILKLDGIIDDSRYSNGTITVTILHKYLVSKFTPRYSVNEIFSNIPSPASFVKVGSDKYQLKSRREVKKEKLAARKGLRGRLTTQETNSFTPDDKALDVEVTADGAMLPIVYGRQPVPGLICANGVDSGGNFIYVVAWCMGPILDIVSIFNNDVALASTAIVHNYRGILCQGLDTIATTIVGITYTDTGKLLTADGYLCAAYSVIYLPSSTTVAPRFQAIIKGRTVYDPRQDGGSTLLTAGTFPDPFNKGDITAVGYNLQFIGTNGTAPTAGMDFSSNAYSITWAGGAVIQSNKLSLDGTGDYVTLASVANTRFGTGRWTLEVVCTPTNIIETNDIYGVGDATNDRCIKIQQNNASIFVSLSSNGTAWDLMNGYNLGALMAAGVQCAIVCEFDWRGYFWYVDGVQKAYTASTSSLYASTATIQIGRHSTSAAGSEFKGTITGVRMTKGYNRYGGIHTNLSTPYPDSASNESGYVYSDTTAGVLADLVKNKYYGLGSTETINGLLNMWKWNEVQYSGVARGVVSLVISEKRPTAEWIDQICGTYGESFWFPEGAGITVKPDRMADKNNPSGWELTTNGDFYTNATDWTLGTDIAHLGITDGILASTSSSGASFSQSLGKPTVAGVAYVVTLSVDFIPTGNVRAAIDGITVIDAVSAIGVYTYEFTATGSEASIAGVIGGVSPAIIIGELSVRRKYWRDDTLIAGSLSVVPLRNSDAPNKIIATYKNSSTTTANWPDEAPITVSMPGIGTDGTPVLETRIRYDGLKNSTRTTLRAKTKLYRLQGKDSVSWKTTDAGLLYQRGMIIELYDAEFDLLIYALLDSVERIEAGRYQCRGDRYSDSHYPGDQTVYTGTIPVGMIFPLFASTVPSGYTAYAPSPTIYGRYIKCAGESLAVGTRAGTTTSSALTGDTSTAGAHGDDGEATFPAKAFTGAGGSGSGRLYTVTDDEAGNHDHTYTTGTITPNLYRRELILVEKTGSTATTIPAEIMTFGQAGLCYLDTFRYTAIAKRLVYAAASAANGGILQQYIPITTGSEDDTHDHWTYTNVTDGTPGGTAVTDSWYATDNGGGAHTHAVTLELTRNVAKYKISLYASGATRGLGPGMMGLWKDSFSSLHQDWTICDGRLGTPFVEGRLLEIAHLGEEDQRLGNNTLAIAGTSRWSAKHEHKGTVDNTDVAAVVEISHSKEVKHRHTISNTSAYGAVNDWEPPSHALALVMYNPNPVPTQKDVALFIEGDMPNASTTIVDASMYGLAATIAGSGTLAYSSAQTLFGLNTVLGGGKRITYPTFTHGKKWSIQGFFRNDATGIMYLMSNYESGHDTQTWTVQKDASGNILLYIGTTLRATVTLSLTSNAWFYVALCYDYAEFRLYAGTVSSGVATRATYASAAFDPWPKLGVFDVLNTLSGLFPFTGYASQIRFITGAAIHSGSNVKIPTEAFPNEHESRFLSGAYDWWNQCGIVDGYYTNMAPDIDPAAIPNNPGGRSSLYRDTGSANVTVSVVWSGVHSETGGAYYGECGIMCCVTPSANAFAIGFNYEPGLGAWVLWGSIGRKPSDILDYYSVLDSETEVHVSGTAVTLSVQIASNAITCKVDGVTKCTGTVPVALQGSTRHGIYCDVNRVPDRPANLPSLVAPFTVTK